jgi:uncharacterized protein (TIGR03085 family)
MTLASDERAAICGEFEAVGPDRPTLCTGWTSRDLLAHLLVRERQPWVAPGLLIPALSPVVKRAIAGYADTPWSEMIAQLRSGPPSWSPFRVGKVDEFGNGAEFFVHHEDVRRGEPGWKPRPPDPTRDAQLWAVLTRTGGMLYRRSPVGVVLRRPSGEQQVVRTGSGLVTIVGEPGELLLHAFGRAATRVELEGAADDIAALAASSRGV